MKISQDEKDHYRQLSREAIAGIKPYPRGLFSGRGIVICGGGSRYFTCAWVCINMLRRLGCTLPIELFYLGPFEMNPHMIKLVQPLGVTCVDAFKLRQVHPVGHLGGWELKVYSLLYCSFEEVILLDADNVPLIDPEEIFSWPEFIKNGAVFWPDFTPITRENEIWEITEVEYRYEPSFESGQIALDKKRAWASLQLAMHYGEHSKFYYPLTGGDKDTFHLAFLRLGQPYAMVPYDVKSLQDATMLQHNFSGDVIFQHRQNAKWAIVIGHNRKLEGFQHEDQCIEFVRELGEKWEGIVRQPITDDPRLLKLQQVITSIGRFVYHRVDHDERLISFNSNQTIGEGSGGLEAEWHVELDGSEVALALTGGGQTTCLLRPDEDGVLRGRWLIHERMPIELIPFDRVDSERRANLLRAQLRAEVEGKRAILISPGKMREFIHFRTGLVVRDSLGDYQLDVLFEWFTVCTNGAAALNLAGNKSSHLLHLDSDGVWREGASSTNSEPLELLFLPNRDSSERAS